MTKVATLIDEKHADDVPFDYRSRLIEADLLLSLILICDNNTSASTRQLNLIGGGLARLRCLSRQIMQKEAANPFRRCL